MEPQLKGCGNQDHEDSIFEWLLELQWSRSSKAAETWIPDYCAKYIVVELQWSRSSKAAETLLAVLAAACFYLASMEPQLKGCGNAWIIVAAVVYGRGFNGAAAQRLRKQRASVPALP